MRNHVNRILLVLGIVLNGMYSIAQSHSSLTLTFKGNVVNTQEKLKNFDFNVFENGKVIYSHQCTNGKFEYTLPYNSSVMVEFNADGHFSKRIALESNSKARLGDGPVLSMTVTLLSTNRFPELDEIQDLLDFPAAFITYDRAGVSYDKNEEFTRVINDALVKIVPGIDYSDKKLASLDW